MTRIVRSTKTNQRWVAPLHGGLTVVTTSQTVTAGRILLQLFQLEAPATVDQIVYIVGSASAGAVTAGIYKVVAEDTASGATLMVQSSSTAQGSINTSQAVSVASTYLPAGRYYVALEFSDATGTYLRQANTTQVVGWTQRVDQTYGTLPTTITSPTNDAAAMPGVKIRLVQP